MDVEDWTEIRWPGKSERLPIRMIARTLRCSKNRVKEALVAVPSAGAYASCSGSVVDEASRILDPTADAKEVVEPAALTLDQHPDLHGRRLPNAPGLIRSFAPRKECCVARPARIPLNER